jgi:hypothetical protein
MALTVLCALSACGGRSIFQKTSIKPRTLRDVPAERLAFRFEGDVATPAGATALGGPTGGGFVPEIQTEFDVRRPNDALLRTVLAPDKQRVLAVYASAETPEGEFRIDLYAADGRLIKTVIPDGLAGAFAPAVGWSPDGNFISFIGRRPTTKPIEPTAPIPDDVPPLPPGITPTPGVPPPGMSIVPAFETEQIYLATRDGTDLKPLTTRPGLIYYFYAWSPDSHSLAAMACLEREWTAREADGLGQIPAGRPRIIQLTGQERLLDDKLSDAPLVWCADGSKIAVAYEYDVKLYDVAGEKPGRSVIPLKDRLLAASRAFDVKTGAPVGEGDPVSFYPVATLFWPDPKTLYVRTGYVPRSESDRPVNVFSRWHAVQLSPQAALLN